MWHTHTHPSGGDRHDQKHEDAAGRRRAGGTTAQWAGGAGPPTAWWPTGPTSTGAEEVSTPATASGNPEPDRLMTIDQVADYTQLPKFTLYKMRSEGRGPRAARLGKHLRYRKSDVDAWIRSKMDDWTDESGGTGHR
jgi:excisionase family DNA binding protein